MSTTTERPQKQARAPKATKAPKTPKIKVDKAPKSAATAPKEAAWPSTVRPSAMLLPAKVAGRRLKQRAVKRSLVAVGAAALILAVVYVPVAAGASSAQARLEDAQAVVDEHRSFLAANADTQNYFDGFITRRQAVAEALVKDVAYSAVVKAINDANTVGATFTEIHIVPKSSTPTTGELFVPSKAVGYLEVSGVAPTEAAVSDLIGALADAKDGLLTDSYLTQSGVARGGTTFKISVGYTEKAMSFKGEPFRPSDQENASIVPAAADPAAPDATAPTTENKDTK